MAAEYGSTPTDYFFSEIAEKATILEVDLKQRIQEIVRSDALKVESGEQITGNCFSAFLYEFGYISEERHVYPLTESEVASVLQKKGYEPLGEYTALDPDYGAEAQDVILIINKHRRNAWDRPAEHIYAHVMVAYPESSEMIVHRHGRNEKLVIETISDAYNDFRKDFEDSSSPLRDDYEQIVYRKALPSTQNT